MWARVLYPVDVRASLLQHGQPHFICLSGAAIPDRSAGPSPASGNPKHRFWAKESGVPV